MACIGPRRLGFVDVARTLAMLLMVNGHVCDALLSESARQAAPVTHYWLVRAFTAPLFLLISGFVFVIASDGRWEEYGRPSVRLLRRVRRAALLILIGYLLQVPRWSGGAPFDFSASEWRSLFRTGVLQCIGLALLIGHGLLALTRTRRAFTLATALVAVAVGASGPLLARSSLPAPAALLLDPAGDSYFPLVPWVAHFLFGAVLARTSLDVAALRGSPVRQGAALLAAGLLLAGLGASLQSRQPPLGLRLEDAWQLGWVALRLGVAWAVLGSLAVALRGWRPPAWLTRLSGRALAVYVVHLGVLYGVPAFPDVSLVAWFGRRLGLEAFVVGPLVFVGCGLAVLAVEPIGAVVTRLARLLRPEEGVEAGQTR